MNELLAKVGVYTKCQDPAVLLVGAQETDFATAGELIDRLCAPEIRLSVVLLCFENNARVALARKYPNAKIIGPPIGGATAMSALLSTLKIRVVVGLIEIPKKLANSIDQRATPVVGVSEVLSGSTGALLESVVQMAGRERQWEERKNRPVGRYFADRLHRKLQGNNGEAGFGGRIKKFADIGSLKTRLGNPKVIMCLGNGPSSESPELANMPHDALFRANHVWMKRDFLSQPDVVFTGMQASMRKIRDALLIVLGDTTEKVLLMTRASNYISGQLEYAVAGGSAGVVELSVHENFRPTSGAIMLSVAVALAPERLIIAGMDMFRHPDGAYPGDNTTANAYTATHDHNHELAFILDQLSRFEGELVIVSKVLQAEWNNYRRAD